MKGGMRFSFFFIRHVSIAPRHIDATLVSAIEMPAISTNDFTGFGTAQPHKFSVNSK
jgi:hypothetical protein